jgi:hypothetical protein
MMEAIFLLTHTVMAVCLAGIVYMAANLTENAGMRFDDAASRARWQIAKSLKITSLAFNGLLQGIWVYLSNRN